MLDSDRAELGWLGGGLAGGDALDQVIRVSGNEDRDRVALLARLVDDPVDVALVLLVGPSGHEVAQVDDKCALRRWDLELINN